MNEFVANSSKARKDAVDLANKAWPSYRDNPDKLSEFIDRPAAPVDADRKPLDFGFQREVVVDGASQQRPDDDRGSQSRSSGASVITYSSGASGALQDIFGTSDKSDIKASYDEAMISSCLESIGIATSQLLTDDVRSVPLLLASLELISGVYLEAQQARRHYADLLVHGTYRGTILSILQGEMDAALAFEDF